MNRNDTEIVLAIRTALAERIGRDRFDVWFSAGVRMRVEGRQVRVIAGDQFLLDRVRGQFHDDLEVVGKQLLGAAVSLDFQLAPAVSTLQPKPLPAPASAGRGPNAAAAGTDHRPSSSQASRRPLSTLDEFVLGPSNCVAFTAAQRVLQNLGQVSPLLVHGPTGTGKTHLLEGVAHAARRLRGVKRVVLMSSEQFTSHFLEALQGSG
ncbi:MAG TPA: DnaA/Hda family protein, partial [Candidatus Anammoximicrobium sp.]|nr:DnaA/Hda family protein [Candidatus Anammoximicrobium sp.]